MKRWLRRQKRINKALYACQKKLKEQQDINRDQKNEINSINEQLENTKKAHEREIKLFNEKFDDMHRELKQKQEKIDQQKNQITEINNQLVFRTKERDRYLKEIEMAEQEIKDRDDQIKRIKTELNLAEKTIEEFINCKERDISSFFDDETIYTDTRKIESILSNLDKSKKEFSLLGKGDDSKLEQCRPYLIQRSRQEEKRQKDLLIELEKEPDLSKLPEKIRKVVEKERTLHGIELTSKQVDKMLLIINKEYHEIKQDKISKIKAETDSEITYLKKIIDLTIPLDKDKARTEIAYLRSELRRSREDMRRLNIIIKRKMKDGYELDDKFRASNSEDLIGGNYFNSSKTSKMFNNASTEDG